MTQKWSTLIWIINKCLSQVTLLCTTGNISLVQAQMWERHHSGLNYELLFSLYFMNQMINWKNIGQVIQNENNCYLQLYLSMSKRLEYFFHSRTKLLSEHKNKFKRKTVWESGFEGTQDQICKCSFEDAGGVMLLELHAVTF